MLIYICKIIPLFIYGILVNVNATSITSFSREGRALNQFNVFRIGGKEILLSKVCIGMLTNTLAFIITSVLIALISSNFIQFILLEVVLIIYMIVIIQIKIDLDSMELKWVDIKDLFKSHSLWVL